MIEETEAAPKKSGRGGARANSGGKRPGAGRPRKSDANRAQARKPAPPVPPVEPGNVDSLTYLRQVVNNPLCADGVRVKAAIALAGFEHPKVSDQGKKPAKVAAAKEAASAGKRFGTSAGPRLAVSNR